MQVGYKFIYRLSVTLPKSIAKDTIEALPKQDNSERNAQNRDPEVKGAMVVAGVPC